MTPRLYRSRESRMLFGVCAGIADRMDIDPTLVRLAFVALFFFGPGLLVYLIATMVIPRAPELAAGQSYRVIHSGSIPTTAEVVQDRSREPMRYGL